MTALTVAWEQWTDEVDAIRAAAEHLRRMQKGREELEEAVRAAEFEYHVLLGRPNVRIVPVKQYVGGVGGTEEEIVLYAV